MVTIKFSLSAAGRKASLLAGGDGKQAQAVSVPADDPHFRIALALADVDAAGNAVLDLSGYGWPDLDAVPSVEELLALPERRRAAQEVEKAAKLEERRRSTQEVLDARTTRTCREYAIGIDYAVVAPAWPCNADAAVTESPEALAWIAELDAANAAAKADAEARAAEKRQAEAEAAAKKEAERQAFRAELGLADGEQAYRIEEGCLARVPVYESHSRGKNWLAVISSNPKAPGGLDREFAAKCKGDLYYDAAGLVAGTAVEFGADYYSGGGRKNPKRWYGCVVRRAVYRPGTEEQAEYLVVVQHGTGKEAIKAAEKVPAQPVKTDAEGGIMSELDVALSRLNPSNN